MKTSRFSGEFQNLFHSFQYPVKMFVFECMAVSYCGPVFLYVHQKEND